MKEFRNPDRGCWVWAAAGASLIFVAACTTYHPARDAGSWAGESSIEGPVYYVRRGDMVSIIAQRAGVEWQRLAMANGLGAPYTIYPGQALRIPYAGGADQWARPAPMLVAATTPEPAAAGPIRIAVEEVPPPEPSRVAEHAAAASPTSGVAAELPADGVYRVQAGEHLLAIARKFGVPMQQIAALNGLTAPYTLHIGQKLQLPVAVAGAPTPSAKPAAHIASPALSGDGFLWPVQGKVVARFGESTDGLRRDGINIEARKGAPVRAAEDGVVVYADEGIRGYGRMILLRHSDDYVTTYAHNATLLVSVGDVVRRGQIIARVGDTGSVDGAQLHFEIRKGLKPLDPEDLLVHEATEIASSE
jgi:LysM repeat protein